MYQKNQLLLNEDTKMINYIYQNYSLLLPMQHFGIDFSVNNKTIRQLCDENKIDIGAFILIINLYNGYYENHDMTCNFDGLKTILQFLKNSHTFYIEYKYPELKHFISKLNNDNYSKDIKLIEKFFDDYFNEVLEHLRYEDEVVFPYFNNLIDDKKISINTISVKDYINHHTDIETKLTDLKNLFLKHIKINNDLNSKRQFLNSLIELEFDIKIHSVIEEKVLVPTISIIEKEKYGAE